jgi:hypothetical protein
MRLARLFSNPPGLRFDRALVAATGVLREGVRGIFRPLMEREKVLGEGNDVAYALAQ